MIDGYRAIRKRNPEINLYNTRLDYEKLVTLAQARQETTVFIELRDFKPVEEHVLFSTGSLEQPYSLFIPNGNEGGGEDIMSLIKTRYMAEGETAPRRSYAYVTGPTKMFPDNENGKPEIIVTDPAQITDWPSAAIRQDTLLDV
ncbi:MAG: hypothetical protein AAFR71_11295 [Pseudomonadota bacterium]